jgi:GntR family transcriptional regulator / MocR family aminotransferase
VRAYEQLSAEGYLHARQGSGTEVAIVSPQSSPVPRPSPRPPSNPGLPSGAQFPRAAWLRSAQRALADLPDTALGYGDPAGYDRLRAELSAYLGRVRGMIAPPERIVIVNGFGQATRLIAEVLAKRDVADIGLENPGSAGLREQLSGVGVRCVPLPVDDQGFAWMPWRVPVSRRSLSRLLTSSLLLLSCRPSGGTHSCSGHGIPVVS